VLCYTCIHQHPIVIGKKDDICKDCCDFITTSRSQNQCWIDVFSRETLKHLHRSPIYRSFCVMTMSEKTIFECSTPKEMDEWMEAIRKNSTCYLLKIQSMWTVRLNEEIAFHKQKHLEKLEFINNSTFCDMKSVGSNQIWVAAEEMKMLVLSWNSENEVTTKEFVVQGTKIDVPTCQTPTILRMIEARGNHGHRHVLWFDLGGGVLLRIDPLTNQQIGEIINTEHKSITSFEYIQASEEVWTCGTDSTIKIWDAFSSNLVKIIQLAVPIRCFCADSTSVWCGDTVGNILVWDINTKERGAIRKNPSPTGQPSEITDILLVNQRILWIVSRNVVEFQSTISVWK